MKAPKYLFEIYQEYACWKIITHDLSKQLNLKKQQGTYAVYGKNSYTVKEGFYFSQTPYCCGVEEIGRFSLGLMPEEMEAVTLRHLQWRKEQPGPGMCVANFVKIKGRDDFVNAQWMTILKKLGFRQSPQDFYNSNPAHTGNIIRQFTYVYKRAEPQQAV